MLLTAKLPNKRRCEQKRRIEAEKTATKCMKLDEMWGKVNVKKMDENQERRDPSSCEDKQEEIPSSSPIFPENVPEILLKKYHPQIQYLLKMCLKYYCQMKCQHPKMI